MSSALFLPEKMLQLPLGKCFGGSGVSDTITQAWGPRDRANASVQGDIPSQGTLLWQLYLPRAFPGPTGSSPKVW